VPDEVIHNFKKGLAEFFKQPLEAKKMYSQVPGSLEGYGQHFVFSESQKLDWADMFYLILRPVDSRDMKFWPNRPPSFRFASETNKITLTS
jgi:isopenicillin N synthase-like dioxygenase